MRVVCLCLTRNQALVPGSRTGLFAAVISPSVGPSMSKMGRIRSGTGRTLR